MNKYWIEYQYGTYEGERIIYADNEDEAISKMWEQMRRRGELSLPMAYQSAKVVKTEEDYQGE